MEWERKNLREEDESMCVKEREYGMGEGEEKVAQERVGDGRESK